MTGTMALARLGVLVLLATAIGSSASDAQVGRPRVPTTPPGAPGSRAPGDTIRRAPGDTVRARADTARARADTALVRWTDPDSVAQALLARPGYRVTRYQAPIVTFDAIARSIAAFRADSGNRAAIETDGRLVTSDSSITYNESTGLAQACGRITLRDATTSLSGTCGEYNMREQSATIRNGRTVVQTDESWLVSADLLKIVRDSAAQGQNYFGRSGNLTSCTDTTHAYGPHYHFAFKEIKRTVGNTLVARPAVLYIADIPVMWLPFVFQDMRSGRRTGMLTPRFGLTDLIRNSPSYRRNVENVGWYWALNDYMDASVALDWLSSTGRGANEAPGWTRYNAEWSYRWIDRFVSGSLGTSYTKQGAGDNNLAVSWNHQQEFTRARRLAANVNWMQNTTVQRQTTINPFAVLATISSQVNLQDKIGPAAVSLGLTRRQYSGRDEVEQTFPTLNVTTGTLNLRPWLTWTPNFQFSDRRRTDITQSAQLGLGTIIRPGTDGTFRADTVRQNERSTSATFDTPIEVFGYNLRNAFAFTEQEVDFPQLVRVVGADSLSPDQERVFARTYESRIDWTPSFALPALAQGTWNLTPSLSFANVDPGPYMVRSQLSGGEWIRQSKRPSVGVSISPTMYALIPGFWGFARFRHAIATSVSYNFAPRASVSDEYLRARNISRRGYLGALPQNQFSLGLNTNLEGKARTTTADTSASPESAPTVRLLSLNLSPISYDVSRYRETGNIMRGLTTSDFSASVRSDLLPGVDFSVRYALFAGDVLSDTAQFSPYFTSLSGSFQLNHQRNPFMLLTRLFGRAVPATSPSAAQAVEPLDDAAARATAVQPIAGASSRANNQYVVPPREGWEAAFTFSSSRQRPPTGDARIVEYDPAIRCEPLRTVNPLAYSNCVAQARTNPPTEAPVTSPQSGGAFYRVPPTTSIGSNLRFNLTPKWAGTWQTNYDVERQEFASHIVSLQRDLHDWRAVFSFTQSPNGSFAFSFFIALKAEPDLKFDYNRATYRQEGAGLRAGAR